MKIVSPAGRGPLMLAMGSVSLVWGLNWVVMKVALAGVGAFEFAAMRLWLAAAFLFACVLAMRKPLRVAHPWAITVSALLQNAITTGLTLWALNTGSAGKNAVLCYAMPFWVVLLAWPLLGERPARRQWLALALAAAGLALLVGGGIGGTLSDLAAEFAAVASGVSWALGIVLTKRLHGAADTDPFTFAAWQTLIGAAGVSLLTLAFPGKATEWTLALALALAYNALLVYGLMWFLWFWLLQRIEAGIASLGTLAVPVVGVLAGLVFLNERPTALEWCGMTFTLGALAITASVAARGGR